MENVNNITFATTQTELPFYRTGKQKAIVCLDGHGLIQAYVEITISTA